MNKKNSFEANGSKKVCKRSQNLIGVIQIYEYFKALICLTHREASLFINVKNIYRGLEKDTMIPNGLTIWNQYCTPIESDYLL